MLFDLGNFKCEADLIERIDRMLDLYREKASDEDIERIAVMCLYRNELTQREEEFNSALNASENGN